MCYSEREKKSSRISCHRQSVPLKQWTRRATHFSGSLPNPPSLPVPFSIQSHRGNPSTHRLEIHLGGIWKRFCCPQHVKVVFVSVATVRAYLSSDQHDVQPTPLQWFRAQSSQLTGFLVRCHPLASRTPLHSSPRNVWTFVALVITGARSASLRELP